MAQKKKNRTKEFPPPKEVPIPMEYANKRNLLVPLSEKRINAIVFHFIHQLRRVIQDPEATSSENTILDRDNPYQPYKPNRFIENIQDARVFQETVCKYKDDPDVFVIGLLAYTDKTHVTGDGRFCAEPVVMVPSFLKLSEMREAKRQMILGLISDMDQKSSSVRATLSTGSPCRNYHAQLSVIVENLREIQKQGGVWMKLRMHGIEVVKRVILPPLVTDNGNRNDASPQNDDQRGGDPDDDDYEEDEEDLNEARESFFADDPVAYQSIWDNGEGEPCLDFLELFKCLLTFNSWVRMDCFWESDFESTTGQAKKARALESVRRMMDKIRRHAPRLDKKGKILSNGWRIPKFHNLVHIVQQVSNFGPVMGIDVEAEESNHKEIVKQNAKTVQKRGDGIFTAQLGHGIWWMQKLEFFRQAAGIGPTEIDELKQGMSPYDCQLRREQQPIQDDMCIVRRGWK